VAALLHGVLAAPEASSRLSSISAAAAAQLEAAAAAAAAAVAGGDGSSAGSITSGLDPCVQQMLRDLAVPADLSVLQPSSSEAWASSDTSSNDGQQQQLSLPPVQQAAPGVPLLRQPAHARLKVLLVLQLLEVLHSWGVTVTHDAALAAALQVLRLCWDTEDVRQSGEGGLRAALWGLFVAAAAIRMPVTHLDPACLRLVAPLPCQQACWSLCCGQASTSACSPHSAA
jgi:hypothetical protein